MNIVKFYVIHIACKRLIIQGEA